MPGVRQLVQCLLSTKSDHKLLYACILVLQGAAFCCRSQRRKRYLKPVYVWRSGRQFRSASGEFEGRTTGELGQKKAVEYLKNFYESHHFKQVGEEYLEDNIPHIAMIKD